MSEHVRSGGSTLARRLACPGSLYAETAAREASDVESEAASLGTRLHRVFEDALVKRCAPEQAVLDLPASERPDYSSLDLACVHAAVDHIYDTVPFAHRGELLVERDVDFRRWVPDPAGARGRLDAAWFSPQGTLHVWDLKTGRVPVSALANPQLRAYALGLLDGEGYLYDVERVEMTILQHVIGNVSVESISIEGLETWGQHTLRPGISRALDPATREYLPSDEACRYCRARFSCRARAAVADCLVADARSVTDGELIGDSELVSRFAELRRIKRWSASMVGRAEERMAAGDLPLPPGFALAEGRTRRRWRDDVTPEDVALAVGDEDVVAEKLLPLGELEKTYGRDALIGLWEKPAGALTVVPVGDVDTTGFNFEN